MLGGLEGVCLSVRTCDVDVGESREDDEADDTDDADAAVVVSKGVFLMVRRAVQGSGMPWSSAALKFRGRQEKRLSTSSSRTTEQCHA